LGIAVGDSFTFGMGVNREQTWSAQLTQLTRCEIVNLGVPGWGPQQYTRALEKYGVGLHPRIIFYGIFRNDFQDAIAFDQWLHDRSVKYRLKSFLQQYSVTFNLLRMIWANLGSATEDIVLSDINTKYSSTKLTNSLQEESRSFERGWPLAEQAIEQAIHETQRVRATFVLLYLTAKEEAYWELIKAKQPAFSRFEVAIDMEHKRVLEFCERRQIFCLDLTQALRKRASQGEKLYFSRDNHWTEDGNRAVALEIQRFLLAKELVPEDRCIKK
jgi:hypothetical protein